jgi:hypothetical protein
MWKLALLSLVLVLTGCESARDSGLWTGTGTYRDDMGRAYNCDSVRADLHRDERYLDVNRVTIDCGFKFLTWGPISFDMYGETVYKKVYLPFCFCKLAVEIVHPTMGSEMHTEQAINMTFALLTRVWARHEISHTGVKV